MTPFAQLETSDGMVKSAIPMKGFLAGAHNLMRNGFWKTVANSKKYAPNAAGWRGGVGRASRLFHDPTGGKLVDGKLTGKSTLLSKGLNAYGIGGLGLGFAGYDLPGADLAMNVTMPGVGALMAAPSLISTARMSRQGNKDKVIEDVKTGAREAVGDMMNLAYQDPRYASHGDLYQQFMSQYSPESSAMVNQYSTGTAKPMSTWNKVQSMFSDPQALVNNDIDQRIPGLLSKVASMEKSSMTALKMVGKGAGHVFPWLFPTMGVGFTANALLSDKPYDAAQVQQRGYAGAQAAMQKKMQNLTGIERMALRLDPTLIGQQAEKLLPGTLAQWEQRSGQKHQPGLISGIVDKWGKGGDNSYYEYDAAGARHYL
jgi:hypothetical protein